MTPRLYLVTPADLDIDSFADRLAEALSGGDVACLLVTDEGRGETADQKLVERLVPIAQAAGTAVLLQNDTRTAGRCRADGVHVDSGTEDLARALETFRPDGIVGVGDLRTRHDAMAVAELGVDYVFFGLLSQPEEAEAHAKTLKFASWWAELFETPCVALAGASMDSVEACAATGADFIALRGVVWNHPEGPAAAVTAANAIFARHSLSVVEDG